MIVNRDPQNHHGNDECLVNSPHSDHGNCPKFSNLDSRSYHGKGESFVFSPRRDHRFRDTLAKCSQSNNLNGHHWVNSLTAMYSSKVARERWRDCCVNPSPNRDRFAYTSEKSLQNDLHNGEHCESRITTLSRERWLFRDALHDDHEDGGEFVNLDPRRSNGDGWVRVKSPLYCYRIGCTSATCSQNDNQIGENYVNFLVSLFRLKVS